jgi:hypothetical protein
LIREILHTAAVAAATAAAVTAASCDGHWIQHAIAFLKLPIWQFQAFRGTLCPMRGRASYLVLLTSLVTACGIGEGIKNFANNHKADVYDGFVPNASLVSKGNYERLLEYDWNDAGRKIIVARHRDAGTTTVALRALGGSVVWDVPGNGFLVIWPSVDDAGNRLEQSGEIMIRHIGLTRRALKLRYKNTTPCDVRPTSL